MNTRAIPEFISRDHIHVYTHNREGAAQWYKLMPSVFSLAWNEYNLQKITIENSINQ